MIRYAILTIDTQELGGKSQENVQLIETMMQEIEAKKVFCNNAYNKFEKITEALFNITEKGLVDLIFTISGTGLAKTDVTPEATMAVMEKEVQGLSELMRYKSAQQIPAAYLFRGRAGIRKSSLIINLPNNKKLIAKFLEAIIPIIMQGINNLKRKTIQNSF